MTVRKYIQCSICLGFGLINCSFCKGSGNDHKTGEACWWCNGQGHIECRECESERDILDADKSELVEIVWGGE